MANLDGTTPIIYLRLWFWRTNLVQRSEDRFLGIETVGHQAW